MKARMQDGEYDAISATKKWVESVVIGLNFCPFAKREVIANSIRYQYFDRYHKHQLFQILQDEISLLNSDSNVETTLLIFASGLESFYDFLDVLDIADTWIEGNNYRGTYQLASFHPDYLFDGELSNAASNYTNRSPYPMLHILRESSLEKAIRAHKSPGQIPDDNIATAQSLGAEKLTEMLESCFRH